MTEAYLFHAITVIGTLIVLEGLLSADNALVLAVLVKHLPREQQRKALLYGIFGAFIFRGIMLLFASWIIRIWYLSALGAGYLAYLAIKHFLTRPQPADDPTRAVKAGAGFWQTVLAVELTDVAFAVDSVMAAVALSDELWLVYTGGILGIIAMRIAAGGFLRILEKWPGLEDMAYALVGWISIKLGFKAFEMWQGHIEAEMPGWLFWGGMAVIAGGGTIWAMVTAKRHPPKALPEDKLI